MCRSITLKSGVSLAVGSLSLDRTMVFDERFRSMFTVRVTNLWNMFLRGAIMDDTRSAEKAAKAFRVGAAPPSKKKTKLVTDDEKPTSVPVGDLWSDTSKLTHLVNQKPRTYKGRRPTYKQALCLAILLSINGFRSGITKMQLANTLILLGVCEPPDVDDMTDIICENHRKGATAGLQIMGFKINTTDGKLALDRVRYLQANRCVYDYLDRHLTSAHKRLLIQMEV